MNWFFFFFFFSTCRDQITYRIHDGCGDGFLSYKSTANLPRLVWQRLAAIRTVVRTETLLGDWLVVITDQTAEDKQQKDPVLQFSKIKHNRSVRVLLERVICWLRCCDRLKPSRTQMYQQPWKWQRPLSRHVFIFRSSSLIGIKESRVLMGPNNKYLGAMFKTNFT